jgi:HD-GYP domain-containing protein (c-di-GMP phosphodiesterase class II)
MSARVPLALVPARSPSPTADPVDDLLRSAAECASAGLLRRVAHAASLHIATAPACVRCRGETPAVHVRCHSEVQPQLARGDSHLCPNGQALRVVAGGRFLAIVPARRVASFHALVERTIALAASGDGFEAVTEDSSGILDATVRSLIAAVDAKDPYTRGHSERVHTAAILVGNELGLDAMTRRDLYWASLLHDIGKIGAPDHILKKPGKLTAEEYRVMMEHPARGDEVLAPIRWLAGARRGVRWHHERFDGTGYPDGLAGEQIPMIARIIAVADTFDAVTSRRAYRGERGIEAALAVLAEAAGTQLDPAVVTIFARHADSIQTALLAASVPPDGLRVAAESTSTAAPPVAPSAAPETGELPDAERKAA